MDKTDIQFSKSAKITGLAAVFPQIAESLHIINCQPHLPQPQNPNIRQQLEALPLCGAGAPVLSGRGR
jgi:hypothetical protein